MTQGVKPSNQISVTSPNLHHFTGTSLHRNSITSPKLRHQLRHFTRIHFFARAPSLHQTSVTSPDLRHFTRSPSLHQSSITSPDLRQLIRAPSPHQISVTSSEFHHLIRSPSPHQSSVTSLQSLISPSVGRPAEADGPQTRCGATVTPGIAAPAPVDET